MLTVKDLAAILRIAAYLDLLSHPNERGRWNYRISGGQNDPWLTVKFDPDGAYVVGSVPVEANRSFVIWRETGNVYRYAEGEPVDEEPLIPFDADPASIVSGDRTGRTHD